MSLEQENFPIGLRVLVVDADKNSLKLMEILLKKCRYNVMTTDKAKEAIKLLKENNNNYDIVIVDVEMAYMDEGIELFQLVGLEMNIPIIMLSLSDDTKLVMQWIKNGACDCLVKPVIIEDLEHIWKHVYRRKKSIRQRSADHPADGNNPSNGAQTSNRSQYMVNKGKALKALKEKKFNLRKYVSKVEQKRHKENFGHGENKDDKLDKGGFEHNEDIHLVEDKTF